MGFLLCVDPYQLFSAASNSHQAPLGGAAPTLRDEPSPYAPSAVNAISNSLRRDMIGCRTADSLIQLLGYVLPIASFHQRHVGHGMLVLHCGHDTDDAVSGVLLRGLRGCSLEGSLRLGHRLALSLRRREIVAAGDRLGLRHLAGLGIHNHFGELVALHCVNGQLELSVLHFILRRNRLAFLHACGKSTLQRDFASRSALATSACSASPGFCAQPIGVMNIHATRNASVKAVFFMVLPSQFLLHGRLRSSASTPYTSRRRSPCHARAGPGHPEWPRRGP